MPIIVSRGRALLFWLAVAAANLSAPVSAATWWWDTTTTGLWTDGANWSDNATSGGATGTVPTNNTTADNVVFNQSSINGDTIVQLNGDRSIRGIVIANTGSTTLQSDSATSRLLTLGADGIVVNAGAGAVTLGDSTNPLTLQISGTQGLVNNSANVLRVRGSVAINANTAFSGISGITLTSALTNSGANRNFANNIVSSGTLALSSVNLSNDATGRTFQVQGSGNTLFNGVISNGTGGATFGNLTLNMSTGGTVTLAVANTYTGTTNINGAGTVVIGNNAAFGSAAGLVLLGASGALQASADYTDIKNPFELRVTTTPKFQGSNSIGLSGTFSVQSGADRSLQNNIGGIKSLTLNAVNLSTTGTGQVLILSGTGNTNFNGVISNGTTPGVSAGGLTINNSGTTTLGGANTYTGITTGSQGVVVLGSAEIAGVSGPLGNSAASNPGSIVLVGSTLRYSSVNQNDYSGRFSTAINQRYNADTNGQTVTWATALASSGGSLTKSGSGTLRLSASNSYTSTTTVSGGVLRLDSDNALPGGIGSLGGISALTINGGVIGLGSGNFSRALGNTASTVQITGGGGFAAYGDNRTVNLGGNATPTPLTWGSGNFVSAGSGTGTFILGAPDATHTVDFRNPIALGSAVRTVQVDDGFAAVDATLSGVLSSNSAGNGLTKTGLGTLDLTAANSFNGTLAVQNGAVRFTSLAASSSAQNLGAGTLVNLGAAATSAGEIDYRGTGGTLEKNITALGSGRNRIRNSGAGTLTLSGLLTKDGTILELASGTFTVTGQITGASQNSDLYINGASVTLSNTNNDYNGPTYVYGNGTLTLGNSNVIPSGSILTLGGTGGGDTGTGTLVVGGLFDSVGGLRFGSAGGTVRMTASGTAGSAQLTASTGTIALAGGTLDLTGSGSTSGLYRLFSAQSVTGAFSSITGTSTAYQVVTTGSTVNYQQRAVLGAVSVTNPAVSIITGGSAAFTYTVANSALSGGADLGFSSGSLSANLVGLSSGTAAASGSSGVISGLVFTGTSIGNNQQGTFTVTAPDAFGATTAAGTVSVTVLDHALPGFLAAGITDPYTSGTLAINFGSIDQSAGVQNFTYNLLNLASQTYGPGLTAGLDFTGVTANGDGFASGLPNSFSNLAGGGTSSLYTFTFTPTAQGSFSRQFTLSFSDNQNLSGHLARRDLTIVANVIVVPEPNALVLTAVGAGAAAWMARNRRRACRAAR